MGNVMAPRLPPKTPGGRRSDNFCGTGWALVIVCSALAGLASTIPQITVKTFILEKYGRGNAFAINGSLESVRALVAFALQPLLGNISDMLGRRTPLAMCALGVVRKL
jgi:MFS family permease